jgi:hypothetical protein
MNIWVRDAGWDKWGFEASDIFTSAKHQPRVARPIGFAYFMQGERPSYMLHADAPAGGCSCRCASDISNIKVPRERSETPVDEDQVQ